MNRGLSLRTRLALWYAVSVGTVLAVYALGTLLFLRGSLLAELDHQIVDHLDFAQHMLHRTPSGAIAWRGPEPTYDADHAWWLRVRATGGRVLFSMGTPDTRAPVRTRSQEYTIDGLPVVIAISKSEGPLRRRLTEVLNVMLLGLPLGMAGAGLVGSVLAGRALRPVGRMASRARSITADRLADRLPVDRGGGELAELAQVFNETFARLEESFGQLRRFTADASHELRTPLTAMRSVGEVALQEQRSAVSYRDTIGSMLEEVDRMGQLVESLLTLSRADGGHIALHRTHIDLRDLAIEIVGNLAVLAEDKEQSVAVHAAFPVHLLGDRLWLRQAITNVVHNAIKYSGAGGTIEVQVTAVDGDAIVDIQDTGPGIPPEHLDRVFDRFYRVDKARSRETGGAGLGLSIARWAVTAHGGTIELESDIGRGCRFRLIIPRGATTASVA